MSNSLLERVRAHQPRAFMMGDGGIFVTARLLPPALRDEVLAYNARFAPPPPRRARQSAPVAKRASAPLKSAKRIAHERLLAACLKKGGPDFDSAEELAREIGFAEATRLIKEHGADAGLCALTERVWDSWGKPPESAA